MKRRSELPGLSSDHHTGLVLPRRGRKASERDDRTAQAEWQRTVERLHAELEPYFPIEQQALLPALRDAGEAALVERTLNEYTQSSALVREPIGRHVPTFADQLRDHVRFEEQVFFQRAEASLDSEALARTAALYDAVQRTD
jgi:hypothetical protein